MVPIKTFSPDNRLSGTSEASDRRESVGDALKRIAAQSRAEVAPPKPAPPEPVEATVPRRLDRSQAERFVELLTRSKDNPVTFQTFDDDKERKSPSLPRILHGTITERWDELVALNQKGAGIYIMVNEGDGKGRKAANVVAVRALFLDDDQGKLTLDSFAALAPSIVVQAKRGLHAYWVLSPGTALSDFTPGQTQLAAYFGTDATVTDLARVMRVPGFLHQKDRSNPFLIRIIQ